MEKKTCGDFPDLEGYMYKKIEELKDNKHYGGYEGKIEEGRIVYFKYWVGKKI